MQRYSHICFGSELKIDIVSSENIQEDIKKCFHIANLFEQKYSRFIKGNYLSQLNEQKYTQIDDEFLSIIKTCLKISKLTQGYFDITVQPILENLGYGVSDQELSENLGYKHIILTENTLELTNNISIDIGSIGKGYMVDKIFNILKNKAQKFIIDFGGDIRVQGDFKVYLEDPNYIQKNIGNIQLNNLAIASSAGNRRKFSGGHHLINAKTCESQSDKLAVYTTHKLATFADIFSTALFVTPLDMALKILEYTDGLEGLIIDTSGKMYKSRGFNYIFYTDKIGT